MYWRRSPSSKYGDTGTEYCTICMSPTTKFSHSPSIDSMLSCRILFHILSSRATRCNKKRIRQSIILTKSKSTYYAYIIFRFCFKIHFGYLHRNLRSLSSLLLCKYYFYLHLVNVPLLHLPDAIYSHNINWRYLIQHEAEKNKLNY